MKSLCNAQNESRNIHPSTQFQWSTINQQETFFTPKPASVPRIEKRYSSVETAMEDLKHQIENLSTQQQQAGWQWFRDVRCVSEFGWCQRRPLEDVPGEQETRGWASTTCFRDGNPHGEGLFFGWSFVLFISFFDASDKVNLCDDSILPGRGDLCHRQEQGVTQRVTLELRKDLAPRFWMLA